MQIIIIQLTGLINITTTIEILYKISYSDKPDGIKMNYFNHNNILKCFILILI